jgi:long-chain acyl-CoA synthetase
MPVSSPSATSLLALAERNAALHPDRLAVAGPKERLTWAGLIARARTIAAAIERRGLTPGGRICLCLPSAPIWVAAFLATHHLGLTAASIGDRARPAELQSLVQRFGVRLVVANATHPEIDGAEVLDLASISTPASAVERRHHDAALIHLTSGSSGIPKGVLRTEADLTEEARNVAAALRLAPDDAVLCATPVYHSFASGLLTACLHAGASCLLMDRLAPAALLDLASRERATIVAGVPYVFQTLAALSSTQTLPALRLAISGGAHLHPEVASSFRRRFGAPLVQEYGLSEAGIVALNPDGPPAAVGTPIPNVELAIIDPEDPSRNLPSGAAGEVVVRRAFPPTGYLDHPGETTETFTPYGIRTGDLGCLDAAGRLTLTGRTKAMINVAGAKVAPGEVEDALLAHNDVAEAVAFAVPDASRGEAVAATVVPHQDAALTEQALREHCRALLSAYKVPAFICIEPELPRTASGKPDLPRIRESALRRLP